MFKFEGARKMRIFFNRQPFLDVIRNRIQPCLDFHQNPIKYVEIYHVVRSNLRAQEKCVLFCIRLQFF
jgi:hypothetical protein